MSQPNDTDPVDEARRRVLADAASDFDNVVWRGQTENERAFLAMLLAEGWSIPPLSHTYRMADYAERIGHTGRVDLPVLFESTRGLDLVRQFAPQDGDRLYTVPFAMFSTHGLRYAVSVDDRTPKSDVADEVFSSAGWLLLRFSDLEMKRDPRRVDLEATALIEAADAVVVADSPEQAADEDEGFHRQMQWYDMQTDYQRKQAHRRSSPTRLGGARPRSA